MTFELIFTDRETGNVVYAINDVTLIRHITPSEVGFTDKTGRIRSCSFPRTENLEVKREVETPIYKFSAPPRRRLIRDKRWL